MAKFVVATLSFFENNIKMQVVDAESDLEAALAVMSGDAEGWLDSCESLEELKDEAFNGDMAINVMEI